MEKRSRREALTMFGLAGVAVAAGCGDGNTVASASSTTTTAAAATPSPSPPTVNTAGGSCAVSPNETEGPYPSLTNLVRSDIREGRAGLPLTLTLTVVNANNACGPVAGAQVEIWQCDTSGHYSQYQQQGYDGRSETYLRGIQPTDASGRATFVTLYPGWYQGRATHIHVEVTVNGRSVKVTQMAFPESVNDAVYRTGVYASRGVNPTKNLQDGIFADSLSQEMATVAGDTTSGYTGSFQVGVAL